MIYKFSEQQKELIKQFSFDPQKDFSEDESEELLEAVADHLLDVGFDENYKANAIGNLCEDIITILTKQ